MSPKAKQIAEFAQAILGKDSEGFILFALKENDSASTMGEMVTNMAPNFVQDFMTAYNQRINPPMDLPMVAQFAKRKEIIQEALALMKVGREKGDTAERIISAIICSSLMRFFGAPFNPGQS